MESITDWYLTISHKSVMPLRRVFCPRIICTPSGCQFVRPSPPGFADVLAMSAFELGYPMHLFVLMEVHYPLLHRTPLSNIQ
jgi:hypothetical protein